MGKNRLKKPALSNSKNSSNIKPVSSDKLPNYDELHPVFCFKYLEDNYGLNKCSKDEKASLVEALRKRSQMTWRSLIGSHRKGLGCEKISRDSIKAPIPSYLTDDVDYFLAFRFHGHAPMVGYRVRDVFRIIWLDSKFDLYNH